MIRVVLLAVVFVFVAGCAKPFNFNLVDGEGNKNIGVIGMQGMFTGTHKSSVIVDGENYDGECTVISGANYTYKGNCRFSKADSFITCSLDGSVGSFGPNLIGDCAGKDGKKYQLIERQ